MITLYHNPACGTSRTVLALIRERGVEPNIVEYLNTPLSAEEIELLLGKMGVSVRQLLREKAPPYAELELSDDKWTDDELIGFMVQHPILMNRPVVVTDKGAKLCRPAQSVLELF